MSLVQKPKDGFPLFKTVEAVIVHAQRTMPPSQILLQRADADALRVDYSTLQSSAH